MPAPSSMLSRHSVPIDFAVEDGRFSYDESTSVENNQRSSGIHQRSFDSTEVTSGNSTVATSRSYDEVFISKPVSTSKTMLWEIKDFETSYHNCVERAMNFEFEVGRLGSVERHLPRRSRWKVMFDSETPRKPTLRVLQLSPESRTIFFRLEAWIMEGADPVKEAENGRYKTEHVGFREGRNDSRAPETLVRFEWRQYGNFVEKIRPHLKDGSLFVKVKIEILEDASSQ